MINYEELPMKWLNILILCNGFLCATGFSANFYLFNAGFSEVLDIYRAKHGNYTLKNFRIRLVAEDLYGQSVDQIIPLLNANHSCMEKAYIPSPLTESSF